MAHTVLIVDDDPLTRSVVKHYLEHAGYRVISSSDGRGALDLAMGQLPQLIILDMMLPDMDGWTVLNQLKASSATALIPVIVLSGSAELVAKEESLQSSVALLLAKPIRAQQLVADVRRLISEETAGDSAT